MAPAAVDLARRTFAPGDASRDFSAQWKNPGDVFSVLLILGGDVVARALAQLAGSKMTPVAFSFGWVAYAVSAVVSAVGDNKLMPPPDTSCQVINAKSGFSRANSSWVIGRIVRDYDDWKDEKVATHLKSLLDAREEFDRKKANKRLGGAGNAVKYPKRAGLCVAVYKAEDAEAGVAGYDFVYWLGFGVCIIQLGVAAIPCGIYGDWAIIQITAVGMILSFITGSLPQWKQEKWACRDKSNKDVILTKGNGSQHAILILGQGKGFDLEDLAAGQSDTDSLPKTTTRVVLLILAVLWVMLLITAAGIKQNTWYLLAIGGIGIAQNVFAAGKTRTPAAYGMPLTLVEVIGSPKVMETLFALEEKYPSAGSNMVGTFFPGGKLSSDERTRWRHLESRAKNQQAADEEQQSKLKDGSARNAVAAGA